MPVLSLRHKASWEDSRPSRELCELFSEWHWENNCFHDHVVTFALAHREELLTSPAGASVDPFVRLPVSSLCFSLWGFLCVILSV